MVLSVTLRNAIYSGAHTDHEVEMGYGYAERNECSYTVEQSMIPGGSNDERLTVLDTRNCYISLSMRLSCVHLRMP